MLERFISDMISKSNYLQAPTIVEDSNETTNENEMGDLKPIAVVLIEVRLVGRLWG